MSEGNVVETVSLADKYRLDAQRALISGRQALVRLLLLQRALDRRDGLNSAGFVSGYRGSPLGGFDAELWKVQETLEANDILFQPGLNEDLALTAVAGTQQIDFLPGAKVGGVFGLWYGKGPAWIARAMPSNTPTCQACRPPVASCSSSATTMRENPPPRRTRVS
jgi:indolepyruvate ferredoxin oxidoreductase